MSQTYGVAWVDGRDPEDGGWSFDGGAVVDGYGMAYEADSRQKAIALGVTEPILDLFEQDGGEYQDNQGYGLFEWLQDHPELFRR